MNGWFVYILHCDDKSFYVGISQDVEFRVQRHNDGYGAEYTKTRRPVILLWKEFAESEKEARKRERQIKGWSRVKKENLFLYGHPHGLGDC